MFIFVRRRFLYPEASLLPKLLNISYGSNRCSRCCRSSGCRQQWCQSFGSHWLPCAPKMHAGKSYQYCDQRRQGIERRRGKEWAESGAPDWFQSLGRESSTKFEPKVNSYSSHIKEWKILQVITGIMTPLESNLPGDEYYLITKI